MNHSTQEANQAHEESQSIIDNAVASGVKIKYLDVASRPVNKSTINKKTPKKGNE